MTKPKFGKVKMTGYLVRNGVYEWDKNPKAYLYQNKPLPGSMDNMYGWSNGQRFTLPQGTLPELTRKISPVKCTIEIYPEGQDAFTELRALLNRIDKDYEENTEYSRYDEGQQDLIKKIREIIE